MITVIGKCVNDPRCVNDVTPVGMGDMAKIFYHGICNLISRLRYISRFIIRRMTRFEFFSKEDTSAVA